MLRTFIYRFTYRLFKDSVGAYAAQITFYMIMSLVPLITLVGMMLTRTNLITADGVIALIQNFQSIPDAARDIIVSVFDNLDRGSTGSYVLYIIIILYAASRSVRGIMNGIHMAYQTVETRPILVIFLISFFYTVAFAIMIVLFVALVLFGEALSKAAFEFFGLDRYYEQTITILRLALPLLLMFLVYLFLYRFIPTKPLKFRNVWVGALFATFASFLVSHLMSASVSNMSAYTSIYGGISQIIVLIIWLYFISMIQLIGAILNATIDEVKGRR